MADRWLLIDEMVSELGAVHALEVEAAAFPARSLLAQARASRNRSD